MRTALSHSTGLKDRDQKLVVYWTLATHALPSLNTFPLLALLGKMGTGKSQTLSVVENFSRHPGQLSLRGMTGPAIRDKFVECYEGTAIVEEADQAWKDADSTFENLLSDRYQRQSATASHKVARNDKTWETLSQKYFGASILHRRIPFRDAALDGRTICVRFRADSSRKYRPFDTRDPWNVEGKLLVENLVVELPEVEQPDGIAARIFNTYSPLLAVARLCGDEDFEKQALGRMQQDTLELREAQSSEPDGLVLGAIVEAVFGAGTPDFRNIKLSTLSESIWRNHRFPFRPRQIGPIARELGFETKPSHGVTVIVPTPAALLGACDECGYTEDTIDKLRQDLLNASNR